MIERWHCEACKRKWAYPFDVCAYCNSPLKKHVGRKVRVVGVTTVGIPSVNHPAIPYQVILLEDEQGNRMAKKTMRKYGIGDAFSVGPAKSEDVVAIVRAKYDVKEAVWQLLALLKNSGIAAGDKVFVKVSCIEPSSQQGASTNPLVLGAAIEWLRKIGVQDIVVGEQALLGDSIDAAMKSGIVEVCSRHDVQFIDVSKDAGVEKEIEGMMVKVSRTAIERKMVNIPAMKTHAQHGLSGALESLVRLLDEDSQKKVHGKEGRNVLSKLSHIFPSVLTIGDASIGMQGNSPQGEPAFMHLLLASKSPINVDRVFVSMGMLPLPNYLKEILMKNIEIVGEELDCVKVPLKQADDGSPHPFVRFVGDADAKCVMGAIHVCRKIIGVGAPGSSVQLAMGAFTKEMLDENERIVLYGKDAIENGRAMGIAATAELTQEMPELQRIVLLRSILENPQKKKIGVADMFKVKMAEFAQR